MIKQESLLLINNWLEKKARVLIKIQGYWVGAQSLKLFLSPIKKRGGGNRTLENLALWCPTPEIQ